MQRLIRLLVQERVKQYEAECVRVHARFGVMPCERSHRASTLEPGFKLARAVKASSTSALERAALRDNWGDRNCKPWTGFKYKVYAEAVHVLWL